MKNDASYVSPRQFAAEVGVHVDTVRQWCKTKRIPCVYVTPRTIRIPKSAMDELRESNPKQSKRAANA